MGPPWILGWDMGVGIPGQGVGSHAKNPAEHTNTELRRSGLEMSQEEKKKKAAVSSFGKKKSSTLFLTPLKPTHSSLKQ